MEWRDFDRLNVYFSIFPRFLLLVVKVKIHVSFSQLYAICPTVYSHKKGPLV